jgi:hypothetical protein
MSIALVRIFSCSLKNVLQLSPKTKANWQRSGHSTDQCLGEQIPKAAKIPVKIPVTSGIRSFFLGGLGDPTVTLILIEDHIYKCAQLLRSSALSEPLAYPTASYIRMTVTKLGTEDHME